MASQDGLLGRSAIDALPERVEQLDQAQYELLLHALSYYDDEVAEHDRFMQEVRQQLWRAQREYHTLFLTNPTPLLVLDERGEVLKHNPAFARAFALADDGPRLRHVRELFEDPSTWEPALRESAQRAQAVTARLRRQDQTTFLAELHVLTTRGGPAESAHERVLMLRDVTQQRHAERRLQMFESIVTRTREALQVIRRRRPKDAASPDALGANWQTVYTNEALDALLGYQREALVGRSPVELFGERTEQVQVERLRQELYRHNHSRQHLTLHRQDGTPIWVDMSLTVIDTDAQGDDYLLHTLRDASDQQELIDRLMRVDRVIAMGTLAAGIGHEISNPLTYAKANVDYSLEHVRELGQRAASPEQAPQAPVISADLALYTSREIEQALEDARHGLERAAAILDDLRTFTYRREPSDEVLSLRALLDAALVLIGHELTHRGQLVREGAADVYVRGDAAKLEQAIFNVLLNAVQALPEARAADNRLVVRLGQDAEEATLEILDNGVGVPPALRDKIFEPFFTTKAPGEGTGLGLSIVQNIVHAHGGSVSLDQDAELTRFTLRLPAAPARPPSALSHEETSEAREDRPHVLIIDDEPQILRVIERVLKKHYLLTVTTRAARALEILGQGAHFDAILCDVMMPEINGVAFYKALMDQRPELLKRLIFISGGAFTPETTSFLDVLNAPLIRKPFKASELLAKLEEICASPPPSRAPYHDP